MSISSFKIEFGSSAWIHFVHTRDAMLRGERAAYLAPRCKYIRWAGRWCPVCGRVRITQDNDIFGKISDKWYCSSCWASFEQRTTDDHGLELWLLPGQRFRTEDFPPKRFLPFSYPITIR